jgi:hypothetical protein
LVKILSNNEKLIGIHNFTVLVNIFTKYLKYKILIAKLKVNFVNLFEIHQKVLNNCCKRKTKNIALVHLNAKK